MVQLWEVVGGADKGGILVRQGKDTTSGKYDDRLSTGALVEEVQLSGDRLSYRRLTGTGPAEGWVSISLPGKPLLVRTSKQPPRQEPARPAKAATAAPPRESAPPAPAPREAPRTSVPRSKEPDPLSRIGQEAAAPAAPVMEEAAPVSDEPVRLGDFGDSEQRSKFRLRAIPPVPGVPSGGFVGTLAWDAPMGQVHDALSAALGVDRNLVSVGWRGRDLQDEMTLIESGSIGSSRGAKQRALEMTVDMVFMLERGVVIKLAAPAAGAGAAASSAGASASAAAASSAAPAKAQAPPAAAPAPRPRPYAAQMEQLAGMGFTDESLVMPLLEAKRGNVQAVLDALLA